MLKIPVSLRNCVVYIRNSNAGHQRSKGNSYLFHSRARPFRSAYIYLTLYLSFSGFPSRIPQSPIISPHLSRLLVYVTQSIISGFSPSVYLILSWDLWAEADPTYFPAHPITLLLQIGYWGTDAPQSFWGASPSPPSLHPWGHGPNSFWQ